jgi:hypothetical protein
MSWFKYLDNTSNLASPQQKVYTTPPLKRRNSNRSIKRLYNY